MGKKKTKKEKEDGPPPLTEVDKTFYELQITDIERKIDRLTNLSSELLEKNTVLENKFKKLDEDKADVISYLKRTLQEKISEIAELIERLSALQQEKETEAKENVIKYEEYEELYRTTRTDFFAEIKKLTVHLNALEDFRVQREELNNRCQLQERTIGQNEIEHKRLLYNIEKRFILGKDAILKETEKHMFDMAIQFEEDNEKKIAPTTKRVIRENVSVNNEIYTIKTTNERLEARNRDLKKQNIYLRQNNLLFIAERDKSLNNAYIQRNVINQLKKKHRQLTHSLEASNTLLQRAKQCNNELSATLQKESGLNHELRKLEQNFHANQCQKKRLETELQTLNKCVKQYQGSIYEAVMNIKSAMKIQSLPEIEYVKIYEGENILLNLLLLLTPPEDAAITTSLPSVQSVSATYTKGDLGFMPVKHGENRRIKYKATGSVVGKSFEDFVHLQALSLYDRYTLEEASIVEESSEELLNVSKEPSVSIVPSKKSLPTKVESTSVAIKEPSKSERLVAEQIEEKYEIEETEEIEEIEEIEEMEGAEEIFGEIDEKFNEHRALLQTLAEGNNLDLE